MRRMGEVLMSQQYELVWEQACQLIRKELKDVFFDTWIKHPLVPLGIENSTLYIGAKTDFYYNYIQPRYIELISDCVGEVSGRKLKAVLIRPEEMKRYQEIGGTEDVKSAPKVVSPLNPKYTFENFVVGSSNMFAHAAALAVADSPATAYNPLYIYGGVGLGKTHLMHAIGNYMLEKNRDLVIRYVTCEFFMNEMVASINRKTQTEFRDKYRNADVLMVDDVQFLANKPGTQEEFFHTFNALQASGSQIILTSDKPPKEIPHLEERLCSRFEGGLVTDISRPDLETRTAILRRKVEDGMIRVDNDVLTLIAENVSTNVRELEGCLNKVIAYASLKGVPITVPLAAEALRDTFEHIKKRKITCDDVIRCASEYYGISEEDIKGQKRNREIVIPRQAAMYLCRELVVLPLAAIGDVFGGRDHSTVNHACQKVTLSLKDDRMLSDAIEEMTRQLTDQ